MSKKKKKKSEVKKAEKRNAASIIFPGGTTGYGEAGASRHKTSLKGFKAHSGSFEHDIDENNQILRERARMMYMSNPVATSAIKTMRTNVIGSGLQLKCRINHDILGMSVEEADAWHKKTEHEFALWAEDKMACDATGVSDFYGIQQLAFTSWLMSGDVFCLFKDSDPTFFHPYSLRLQLVEADRVATPVDGSVRMPSGYTTGQADNGNLIYDGVEVDQSGKVVAYHICSEYPYDYSRFPIEWTRVEAYSEMTGMPNVLHLMTPERPDQKRGVSILAQSIERFIMLNRYQQAELAAATTQSYLTTYITTASPSENPFNEAIGHYELSDMERNPDDYQMGPGQVNFLAPGETVSTINPSHPASGYSAFTKAQTGQIGASVEVPGGLLNKEFNSSYSASRAELLEFWKSVEMHREWFTADFCRPTYEQFLSEAVAIGRIEAPGFFDDPAIHMAWLGSEWVGPSQGQLDPTKEIQAKQMAIELGLTTHADAAIEYNGSDWAANVAAQEKEYEILARIRKPIVELDAIAKKGEEGLEKDAADAEKKGAEADATETESDQGQNFQSQQPVQ